MNDEERNNDSRMEKECGHDERGIEEEIEYTTEENAFTMGGHCRKNLESQCGKKYYAKRNRKDEGHSYV